MSQLWTPKQLSQDKRREGGGATRDRRGRWNGGQGRGEAVPPSDILEGIGNQETKGEGGGGV